MGDVWVARDERLEREVALKILRDPLDPQHATRFLREARAVASLVHPNIVTLFDYGEDEGQLFMAMQYVSGEPLSETIRRRRPLPLGTRLRLLEELCAGLAHAHAMQIVHRDIKPANLMLGLDGRLRILDFGIARQGVSTLTQGHLLGSLNYMSPEQLALRPADVRSDIFAVGAVSYELLSYTQAFSGPTVEAVVERIRDGEEPLERVCPELDAQIVRIVTRALERDPAHRFQDIGSMQRAVERARRQVVVEEEPETETQVLTDIATTVADAPAAEPPRRSTDRESLERRRISELRDRLAEARAALEIGDYSAAVDYAEQALLLSPTDIEARDLVDRCNAALAAAPPTDAPAPDSRAARLQARLIDRTKLFDYGVLAAAGLLPLLLAWRIGALTDSPIPPATLLHTLCTKAGVAPVIQGYGSRANWWPYFAMLPFVLLMVRFNASRFFPLEASPRTINRGLLLRIDERYRPAVGRRLAAAARDSRNLTVVLLFGIAINAIDIAEVGGFYVAAWGGQVPAECPRELDWTVHFLSGESSVASNFLLTASAYANQFVIHCLAMMGFGLLLRHNWFYLRTIYQRHRARRRPDGQFIVLDFNDVERCFGLRVLHSTFNLQIMILIIGGIGISSTRVTNVDATIVSEAYQRAIAQALPALAPSGGAPRSAARPIQVRDLFPDPGQTMLAVAWVFCFAVVAMPSAVKFLPIIYKHVRIVGRKEYLTEFLPPRLTPPIDTQEDLDALAQRFARSAFWPAGDERARTLYTFAYFVFFFVLVPVPPDQGRYLAVHVVVLLTLAVLSTRLTFWMFRKALVNIDASLAQT
jgi:serine/threonine-protein kinase